MCCLRLGPNPLTKKQLGKKYPKTQKALQKLFNFVDFDENLIEEEGYAPSTKKISKVSNLSYFFWKFEF